MRAVLFRGKYQEGIKPRWSHTNFNNLMTFLLEDDICKTPLIEAPTSNNFYGRSRWTDEGEGDSRDVYCLENGVKVIYSEHTPKSPKTKEKFPKGRIFWRVVGDDEQEVRRVKDIMLTTLKSRVYDAVW